MQKKQIAFTIDTLQQAESIIKETKIYKIIPIIHFKSYIIAGFGSDFIITFKNKLVSKFGRSRFKIFVDCGYNRSLGINMAILKIDYIKVLGNSIIIKKVKDIANKNKVSLNPSFNIVDCRNIKNFKLKIQKIYARD